MKKETVYDQTDLFENESQNLELDYKSLIWRQLDRVNIVGTFNHDSPDYINAVESVFYTIMPYADKMFIDNVNELNKEYEEKFNNVELKNKSYFINRFKISFADDKRLLLMGLISRAGLSPKRGKVDQII